jgi:hypothetical protein
MTRADVLSRSAAAAAHKPLRELFDKGGITVLTDAQQLRIENRTAILRSG